MDWWQRHECCGGSAAYVAVGSRRAPLHSLTNDTARRTALQGLMPFAPRQPAAAADAGAPAEAHGAPAEAEPAAEPQQEPTHGAEDAAGLAATAPAAPAAPLLPPCSAPPQQEGEAGEQLAEAAVQSTPPQEVPLSAAKPVSRSQLRQQLQLRSQRASGASSPAVRAAGRVVGTPAGASSAAGGRSTRGQRLLGLVRQQQHPAAELVAGQHAAAIEEVPPGAQLLAAEHTIAEGMDVDVPAGNAAAGEAEQQLPVAARQLAQRRLTQSPCRMAVPGGSKAGGQDAQAPPDVPAQMAGGECTPSRPPPAALSTPTIAEPGSAPRPGQAAAARAAAAGPSPGRPSGSPLQAASAQEGDVDAALQQVRQTLDCPAVSSVMPVSVESAKHGGWTVDCLVCSCHYSRFCQPLDFVQIACRWAACLWTCETPRSPAGSSMAQGRPSLPARPSRSRRGWRPPCSWMAKVRAAPVVLAEGWCSCCGWCSCRGWLACG